MRLLVGLDVGTSAVKGVLLGEDGRTLAHAVRPTDLRRPAPGQAELDPDGHYRRVCSLLRELAAAAPPGGRVAALAMAAASGNTLLTDEAGRPLTPILSWMDRRAVGRGEELLPGLDFAGIHGVVGWPWSEMFPLAHLAWLRRERPQDYTRATRGGGRCAMDTDWLLFRLTGRWGMDPSTATTFYLQDQVGRRWHRPYLSLLDVPESALSRPAPSGTSLGPLTPQAATDTGLPPDTRVVLGAFDHPCAARGTGILQPGELLLSCGTSWVGFYPLADRDLAIGQRMLVDPFLQPAGPWGAMFALTANGVAIDWCIDHLVLASGEDAGGEPAADRYAIFNRAAAGAPPGAGGLFLNTCRGVEETAARAPAAAAGHSREEVARAVMEGTAFEMRRRIDGLAAAGIGAQRLAMVGGPAESPVWPALLAEVTGLEMRLVNGRTAGAFGAAVLAAVGAGLYRGEAEAWAAMGPEGTVLSPTAAGVRLYRRLYDEYRAREP